MAAAAHTAISVELDIVLLSHGDYLTVNALPPEGRSSFFENWDSPMIQPLSVLTSDC